MNRTTRRASLSDEGREYYGRCNRVLAEVEAAEASLSARRSEPSGRLRVTAPVMYGRMRIAPVVLAFMARYRKMEIELVLLDRIVDLVEEGIDVALRIGHLPDSACGACLWGKQSRVVCAAPGYLKRAGIPKRPADLAGHRCVIFSGLASNQWSFGAKRLAQVTVRPALKTNQFDVAIEACLQGMGCGQFLCCQRSKRCWLPASSGGCSASSSHRRCRYTSSIRARGISPRRTCTGLHRPRSAAASCGDTGTASARPVIFFTPLVAIPGEEEPSCRLSLP